MKLFATLYFHKIILLSILLLALALRLWNLGGTPPGVLVDEASLGFNASSILKTGADEWGEKLPLTLKSFGDYKPAGYAYIAIPFIKIFGLTTFSTRLPSSLAGIIAVICLYFIGKKLFNDKNMGLIAAFLLSVNPWHIYESRMAWEANVALTFFLIAIVILLYYPQKTIAILLSSLFFASTMYVYVGYRLATPILFISFLALFFKRKIISPKNLLLYTAAFLFFIIPIGIEMIFYEGSTRLGQVSILNKTDAPIYINEQREFCGLSNNKALLVSCYLLWNKPIVLTYDFIKNYFLSYSNDFLFITGDTAKFINNPQYGGFFIWLFPLFLLGLYISVRKRTDFEYKFILLWLIASPIMPAIANKPHFIRSNMLIVPIILISAITVYSLYKKASIKKVSKSLYISAFIALSLLSTTIVMVDYFFIYTKKAMAWDEEYKTIYSYIKTHEADYDRVYIKKTNTNPYIYAAFYLNLDPKKFQKEAKRKDFAVNSVGKYKFQDADFKGIYCQWIKDKKPKSLFVTNEEKLPLPLITVKSFNKVHNLMYLYDMEKTISKLSDTESLKCQ